MNGVVFGHQSLNKFLLELKSREREKRNKLSLAHRDSGGEGGSENALMCVGGVCDTCLILGWSQPSSSGRSLLLSSGVRSGTLYQKQARGPSLE